MLGYDALIVDVRDGDRVRHETRCPGCAAGFPRNAGPPVFPNQPSRTNYKTEGGYARAVERAFACDGCGEPLRELQS
ncbi:MAG: hypothetical protein F4Y57_08985 [Acidobacteria bacterium]|nr:hypothetical protein [Acidobacteriota bacterium]